jgi:hypothetical protein
MTTYAFYQSNLSTPITYAAHLSSKVFGRLLLQCIKASLQVHRSFPYSKKITKDLRTLSLYLFQPKSAWACAPGDKDCKRTTWLLWLVKCWRKGFMGVCQASFVKHTSCARAIQSKSGILKCCLETNSHMYAGGKMS